MLYLCTDFTHLNVETVKFSKLFDDLFVVTLELTTNLETSEGPPNSTEDELEKLVCCIAFLEVTRFLEFLVVDPDLSTDIFLNT